MIQLHPFRVPVALLFLIAVGVGCEGSDSSATVDGSKVARAATATAAADSKESALASAYDAKADHCRQLAATERTKVAASARAIAAVTASSQVGSNPEGKGATAKATYLGRLVAARDALASKREKAAALADQCAAQTQKVADFHRALAVAEVAR